MIFDAMSANQQVMLVPGTFGCSNTTANRTGLPVSVSDGQVFNKLTAYFEWMKADKRIAGINPWHFDRRGHAQSSGVCDLELGAVDLPRSLALLKTIGEWIGPL